jgi:phosphotransferase system HPr (HPr) family protein
MVERTLRTGLALHARPLDGFVRLARRHACAIRLRHGTKAADGRNVTQLLLLGIPAGAEVTLSCDGPGEADSLAALAALLAGGDASAEPAPAAPLSATATGIHAAVSPRQVFEWTPGAPGIGVGRLRRPARPALVCGHAPLAAADERARLARALEAARSATDALIGGEDDPFCDIFRAQRTLLEDPALAQGLHTRLEAGAVTAEGAVAAEFAVIEARFAELGTVFAAERHADVADVRDRILEALGVTLSESAHEEDRAVLALREATPSRMALLDLARVAAVISERGGPTSHAAIVARGRGIPLVFMQGASEAFEALPDGAHLMVDGTNGVCAWLPEGEQPALPSPPSRSAAASGPARTADGVRVYLRANLGAPGDLGLARQHGSDGCGLLRSELLFAGRREVPSLEEQARAYARVASALAPHPTVVRLFDAGSDKPLAFLPAPGDEPNPALGRRGARLLLAHPEILGAQLQAVALARQQSGCELSALVPMLSDIAQLERVRALAPAELPLGAMIETPAAVLLARSIAQRVAFLSVGTNDLHQYLLARDRTRSGASVHPALIRAVAMVVREAGSAGCPCSICGELASDAAGARVLCGLGVRVLSVAPATIPALRDELARWSLGALTRLAEAALEADDPRALADLFSRRGVHGKELT